jgi:hypothetical protein
MATPQPCSLPAFPVCSLPSLATAGGGEEAGTAAARVRIEESDEHGLREGRTLDVASAGEAEGDKPLSLSFSSVR